MLQQTPIPPSTWESEVVYQVFPRSFADSNGDRIGDFKGIAQHLGYIKSLGATVILLQPILKSRLYHNYFPDSFDETDPKFGSKADFFDLVHEAHRKNLRVVLDMEIQYVAGDHPWYRDSLGARDKTGRAFSGGPFNFSAIPSYSGQKVPVATVNFNSAQAVRDETKTFLDFAAPPGRKQDGVDGFRLDHMMDDLDDRHLDTSMYDRFWIPMETAVKAVKPNTFFVAEQADWGLGIEQFKKGEVDCVYAIPLWGAVLDFLRSDGNGSSVHKFEEAVDAEQKATPAGGTQLIFVENHDVNRLASVLADDPRKLRLAAIFNLCLKGTPSIYYGQELGMRGEKLSGQDDGNDIPIRLAFRWNASIASAPTATWYGMGTWNKPSWSASGDGISVEEEQSRDDSLLNFYRNLIHLRQQTGALKRGDQTVLEGVAPGLVVWTRSLGKERVLVAINPTSTATTLDLKTLNAKSGTDLWAGTRVPPKVEVGPLGFRILRL